MRPTTLPPPWREMAAAAGGVAKLAAELGVSPRTLRSWGAGERKPGQADQREANNWAKLHGLKGPWKGR